MVPSPGDVDCRVRLHPHAAEMVKALASYFLLTCKSCPSPVPTVLSQEASGQAHRGRASPHQPQHSHRHQELEGGSYSSEGEPCKTDLLRGTCLSQGAQLCDQLPPSLGTATAIKPDPGQCVALTQISTCFSAKQMLSEEPDVGSRNCSEVRWIVDSGEHAPDSWAIVPPRWLGQCHPHSHASQVRAAAVGEGDARASPGNGEVG